MGALLRRVVKSVLPLAALGVVGAIAAGLLFGDGCGPVERGLRAALGTWDMWETKMVAPFEEPLRLSPEDIVPVDAALDSFTAARGKVQRLSPSRRKSQARRAYRRYCHHCHGPNGDNRIIVGESFGFQLPDLRSDDVQDLDDEDIFSILTDGSARMIPLGPTVSPLDRILAAQYVRTLKGSPSRPFFPGRWREPAQRPVPLPAETKPAMTPLREPGETAVPVPVR